MAEFTLQALKDEILNDPQALGLLALYNNGQDLDVALALNLVREGVAYSIFKKSVPIHDMIMNIEASEFGTLTSIQIQRLQFLFNGTATIDATDANTRQIVTDIFVGKPNTLANFAIIGKKQASRAEVLWGDGFAVSHQQVAQTRQI